MKFTSTFVLLLSLNAMVTPSTFASDGAEAQVKKALSKASKAERLPNAASIVVFGQGEAVVLTDNPRWVVKGKLYDMWQNTEVEGPLSLQKAAKKIPINTIKVNTHDLIDARVRPEKESVLTVFLDPFEASSPEVVHLLNTYATDYQVRYIYTAMSQDNIEPFFDFACQSQAVTADAVSRIVINQEFIKEKVPCRKKEAMNSFGLTQFLQIKQSPVLIAPNDNYHVGLPAKLMDWLKENTI